MYERITLLALIVAALSMTVAGIVYFHCRKTQREKNFSIARALHEQDQLKKELERVCIEKHTMEKLLTARLLAPGKSLGTESDTPFDTEPDDPPDKSCPDS